MNCLVNKFLFVVPDMPDKIQHIKSAHKKEKFDCSVCGNQFTTKKRVAQHVRSVHIGMKHK